MSAAGELQGPVSYAPTWGWLAAAAAVVTVLYYVVVWWATRPRSVAGDRAPSLRRARRRTLRRLDEIERRVRRGELPATAGHQQLSAAVREFVATAGGPPAPAMTLAALRDADAPDAVVRFVQDLYAPAFAGDEQVAVSRFDDLAATGRELVSTWT